MPRQSKQSQLNQFRSATSEINPQLLLQELATRIAPSLGNEASSRAWKWKSWLETGEKNKFDLYDEINKAPGDLAYHMFPTQKEAHESQVLTKQFVGGWRLGKSMWLAAEILPYMFKDNAVIWIVANDYIKARYEFTYVWRWLQWLGVEFKTVSDPGMGPWRLVTVWGAELKTQTGDDVTKIEGGNLDAAAVAEAGLMSPEAVRRLGGRVMTKGGPILMSGSLDQTEPWYMESFEKYLNGPQDGVDWQSWGAASWENTLSFPGGREDSKIIEREKTMTEDEFKLKIACEVAHPQEIVFPEFDRRKHVIDIEFADTDPDGKRLEYPRAVTDDFGFTLKKWVLPRRGKVHISIDPGSRGAYAVMAIRKYDDQVFVIDEVYMKYAMVTDVIEECKLREWWVDVDFAVMDIAGKQRPAMASQDDIWAREENLGFHCAMTFIHIEDGIEHLKIWLKNPLNKQPRIWFSPKCKNIIEEFRLYRYRTERENRPVSEEPVDKYNHAIKAVIYYLWNRFKPGGGSTGRTTSVKYVGDTGKGYLSDGRPIYDSGYKRYTNIQSWALNED